MVAEELPFDRHNIVDQASKYNISFLYSLHSIFLLMCCNSE